jgi:hypothetical protein
LLRILHAEFVFFDRDFQREALAACLAASGHWMSTPLVASGRVGRAGCSTPYLFIFFEVEIMNSRILLVVGDKFASYVQGKDAITLSQLRGLLSFSVPLLPSQGVTLLVPGQGLSDTNIKNLLAEAAVSPNLAHFDFSLWHNLPQRAPTHLTHKHIPANTLVSVPRQLSEFVFESDLMIDEDCELMSDHQSGQHVQGMVLVEAARQILIAVTEAYFIPKNDIDYSFIFNGLSVNFNQFAFPLGAVVRCTMKEASLDNPRRLSFSGYVEIEQCGQVVCDSLSIYSAMEKVKITKREGMGAAKSHSEYLTRTLAAMQQDPEPLAHVDSL